MNPNYCTIGKIVSTHGRRGEVKMVLMTDFPERLVAGQDVFLEPPSEPVRATVVSVRPHKGALLVGFDGVTSISEAEKLAQKYVRIRVEDLKPLGDDEYYWHELEGLLVEDKHLGTLGKVLRLTRAGELGGELLVVGAAEGELLIPMVERFVLGVDLEEGKIFVDVPEEMASA